MIDTGRVIMFEDVRKWRAPDAGGKLKTLGRILLLALEIVCYLALITVVAAILGLIFVSVSGVCEGFDMSVQNCSNPTYLAIGNYSYTILLMTVFTGFPGLFAIGGIVFALKRVHKRKSERLRNEGREEEVSKFGWFLLKAYLYLMGIVFVVAVIVGIISDAGS